MSGGRQSDKSSPHSRPIMGEYHRLYFGNVRERVSFDKSVQFKGTTSFSLVFNVAIVIVQELKY